MKKDRHWVFVLLPDHLASSHAWGEIYSHKFYYISQQILLLVSEGLNFSTAYSYHLVVTTQLETTFPSYSGIKMRPWDQLLPKEGMKLGQRNKKAKMPSLLGLSYLLSPGYRWFWGPKRCYNYKVKGTRVSEL